MDDLDMFIDKISKGQDTSYDDISATTDTNMSATQNLSEGGNIWAYDYISENNLPKRK